MRSPHDFRHEAVVQVENVGSKKVADGVNGVRASGLGCMYLVVVSGKDVTWHVKLTGFLSG